MEGSRPVGEERQPSSVLLADVGTVVTKAVLLDRTAGQCRFVAQGEAPTTLDPPWADVTLGLRDAINQISVVTGREFFDGAGDLIVPEVSSRKGADLFSAVVSAAPSLRAVVCGLSRDLSAASAVRAVLRTYSRVVKILSVEQTGSVWRAEDWARQIAEAQPDVVVVAGGTDDGGVLPVLQMVLSALSACGPAGAPGSSTLLYAGNSGMRGAIQSLAASPADVRFAANVRPQVGSENLSGVAAGLDALYVERQVGRLPGADRLCDWCSLPPAPTSCAYGRMVEYISAIGDEPDGVLGVDVGAAHTVVASAHNGHLSVAVANQGVALTGEVLRSGAFEDVSRWLPKALPPDRLRNMLAAREERPAAGPLGPDALWVGHALARESLRAALDEARSHGRVEGPRTRNGVLPFFRTVVASGAVLARAPRPGQAALVILDGLQPTGIFRMVLDSHRLVAPMGSITAEAPLTVVEALAAEGLADLATVVAPVGRGRPGDVCLKARVTYDDGGTLEAEVGFGDIEVLPLLRGQGAVLDLYPRRRFDVGLGGPGKGGQMRVRGGLAGLIIDARGRPMVMATDPGERLREAERWLLDVGG